MPEKLCTSWSLLLLDCALGVSGGAGGAQGAEPVAGLVTPSAATSWLLLSLRSLLSLLPLLSLQLSLLSLLPRQPGTGTVVTRVTDGTGRTSFPPGSAFQGLEIKGSKMILDHSPLNSRENGKAESVSAPVHRAVISPWVAAGPTPTAHSAGTAQSQPGEAELICKSLFSPTPLPALPIPDSHKAGICCPDTEDIAL